MEIPLSQGGPGSVFRPPLLPQPLHPSSWHPPRSASRPQRLRIGAAKEDQDLFCRHTGFFFSRGGCPPPPVFHDFNMEFLRNFDCICSTMASRSAFQDFICKFGMARPDKQFFQGNLFLQNFGFVLYVFQVHLGC